MSKINYIPYGRPSYHICLGFQSLHIFPALQTDLHKNPAHRHEFDGKQMKHHTVKNSNFLIWNKIKLAVCTYSPINCDD